MNRESIISLAITALLLVGIAIPVSAGPLEDPGNLTAYKDSSVGTAIEFKVTGSTTGSLWGSDAYTLDSALAVAAVHAGVVKDGETGTVLVTITEGRSSYDGTVRNGARSNSWGAYEKSYTVAPRVAADPGSLTGFRDRPVGTKLEFKVTGSTTGSLWGSKAYTLDSTLAVAAVHAGALNGGETGTVVVTITEGRPSYDGTVRNGARSSSWGTYEKSYNVARAK